MSNTFLICLLILLLWFLWLPESAGKWLGQIYKGYQIEMRAGEGK